MYAAIYTKRSIPVYKKEGQELLYWQILQNKLNIKYDPGLSDNDISDRIKLAYGKNKNLNRTAESLSLEYISQLAMAKEEAGEIKAVVFLKTMNPIEAQRRLFRNIRTIENEIRGGSTTHITITDKHRKVSEYTERRDIEILTTKSTEGKRY